VEEVVVRVGERKVASVGVTVVLGWNPGAWTCHGGSELGGEPPFPSSLWSWNECCAPSWGRRQVGPSC